MNWFWIALVAPSIWALANHIDKHVVTKYFKGSDAGAPMIITGAMGLLVIVVIAVLHPAAFHISLRYAVIIAVNGLFYVFGIVPYMYALQKDEASKVVPLFQFTPIFIYILALVFLKESLSLKQIVASLLIILGAFLLSSELNRKSFKIKKVTLGLMTSACFLLAINTVVFKKFITSDVSFWTNIFWTYVGVVLSGVILLVCVKTYRKAIFGVLKTRTYSALGLISFSELISLIARLFFYFAATLAPVALVQTVSGLQPLIVFIYGVLITLFVPRLQAESLLRKHLAQKLVSIFIIVVGTYLLLKP